jgi:hypothetical protein
MTTMMYESQMQGIDFLALPFIPGALWMCVRRFPSNLATEPRNPRPNDLGMDGPSRLALTAMLPQF